MQRETTPEENKERWDATSQEGRENTTSREPKGKENVRDGTDRIESTTSTNSKTYQETNEYLKKYFSGTRRVPS
jgi:hypothetical protein